MSVFKDDALAGKRILITGGGTGLGKLMAMALAAHGAHVHLWGRRRQVLDEAAAEVGPSAHAQVVNVRDPEAVDAAMQALWEEHGR